MKIPDARSGLRERSDGELTARGFVYSPAMGAYCSAFPGGERLIHCRLVAQGGAIVMILSASIRFEEVERNLNIALGKQTDAKDSSTLWVSGSVLLGRSPTELDLRIRESSDLDSASQELLRFSAAAETFFATMSDLSAVDRVLNSDLGKPSPYQSEPRRSEYGVLVAAALKRPDLAELIEAHRARLSGIDRGVHVEEFERVVASLA